MLSSRGRRRRAPLVAALGLSLALVPLAGCSTTRDLVDAGAATGSGDLGGDDQPSPGVTDDKVDVGIIYTDLTSVSEAFGFKTDPAGDYEQQLAILTDWVNDNGGLGGRTMRLVVKEFNASEDSPAAEQAMCDGFVKDEHVFAVVLTGQLQSNARECYKRGRTVAVDEASYMLDRQTLAELAPFVWSPETPVMDDFATAYVNGLAQQGFFEGSTKVGIVAGNTAVAHRMIEQVVLPLLDEVGVTDPVTGFADASDANTLGGAMTQTTLDFQSKGVDRVLFFGGGNLAPFFGTNLGTYNYYPRLGLSSFDSPLFITRNSDLYQGTRLLEGAASLSFRPSTDVEEDQLAFPATFAESQCLAIYASGGLQLTTRSAARSAFGWCSAILFLKSALDRVGSGPVTPKVFGQAAGSLQGSFQSPLTYATYFDTTRLAGSAVYRMTTFDTSCSCFRLATEPTLFAGVPEDILGTTDDVEASAPAEGSDG